MKLQFKHQQFQADAAWAVCEVFAGQPIQSPDFRRDIGIADPSVYQRTFGEEGIEKSRELDEIGYKNNPIVISEDSVLKNIQRIQRTFSIEPSLKLEGKYNLTIEMETGVGKTYTYTKTMYELNSRYGFTKFIIVVPSVAIREGVYKSLQLTEDHFAEEYGKKIRYFIYNSRELHRIDQYTQDNGINVMIINSQAFNARGKDARRIYMQLDSFRSRRPIDVISAVHPILIIDEPQSVEGEATRERLKKFNPLFTLRYSATHRRDQTYNQVYRLDALDAYNQQLVKKIAVKGISVSGSTGTEGYLYLDRLNFSQSAPPSATLEIEVKGKSGVLKKYLTVSEGYNLFEKSGELEQYRGYVVSEINGNTNSIRFTNGNTVSAGEVQGIVNEEQMRQIQIRETITTHLERERSLFYQGIKVLTLFFIDEVAKYRVYGDDGEAKTGEYANIFIEEYRNTVKNFELTLDDDPYLKYLKDIQVDKTHQGYFSIDKKNHFVNSKVKRRETISDDVSAYDLIMKNKERLLDFQEPVRFIFSHSALREGWDNPNVFQICTLKSSSSDVRKRQEVGRGLRLCVNRNGERMDTSVLGSDIHAVNLLTVIASESYDSFARQLQEEMAEAVADRPRIVEPDLFAGKTFIDAEGKSVTISPDNARKIYNHLIRNNLVDDNGTLTDQYYSTIQTGTLPLPEDLKQFSTSVQTVLGTVYSPQAFKPEDAGRNPIIPKMKTEKLEMKEFKALWDKINKKTAYLVQFNSEELLKKSIASLNEHLKVQKVAVTIEKGVQIGHILDKKALCMGEGFEKNSSETIQVDVHANSGVRYDLIGKIGDATKLTRRDIAHILKEMKPEVFSQFSNNPEDFIIKASRLINEQKATVIVEHIEYHLLKEEYDTKIFTDHGLKRGNLGDNAIAVNKCLYDHVVTDSLTERKFASDLDTDTNVAIYVKLPGGFYIDTPVGKYNPDWAIAFYEGTVKHIYFVAETKGDLSSLQLREIESLKIHCAREHFKKISNDTVRYEVVSDYQGLLNEVMK